MVKLIFGWTSWSKLAAWKRRSLPCPVLYHCVQPVSWLLLGELFPLEDRALGTAVTTAFRSVPFSARLSLVF